MNEKMVKLTCPYCRAKQFARIETESNYKLGKNIIRCRKKVIDGISEKGCGKFYIAEINYKPEVEYFKIKKEVEDES